MTCNTQQGRHNRVDRAGWNIHVHVAAGNYKRTVIMSVMLVKGCKIGKAQGNMSCIVNFLNLYFHS